MSVPMSTLSPGADILIPLADIVVPDDRARELDSAWADALASIIDVQGLTNPITVRQTENGLRLVTGLHRHAAFIRLNRDTIPARLSTATSDDEARLEEVMENLGRNELKALDRCHHLYELKLVYERLHPEAAHGGDRGNQHTGGKRQKLPLASRDADIQAEVFGFSVDTAEKIGLSERAIRMAVAIWKGLSVASRIRCAGTWLAGHQGNLKLLSDQTPAFQKQVLDMILADAPKATSVAEALVILEQGRTLSHVEKKFASLNKAITNLKDDELDAVLAAHEQRIVAWLQRTGRI